MEIDSQSQSVPVPTVCSETAERANGSLVDDIMQLTKARLTLLVLVTCAIGFLLADSGPIHWLLLLHTLLGTALVAAGASIFNQVLERKQDALMQRTATRPLPAGRISVIQALTAAVLTTTAGSLYLAATTTLTAAMTAVLTCLIYVALYTPLKTRSSSCTLVGAVSGALPPVIGWTAAGGALDAGAVYLFALMFFWQMPHFLAINWMYRKEYQQAGFRMWSNDDCNGRRTAWLALGFTVMLAVACLIQPADLRSTATLVASLLVVLPLLYFSVKFLITRTHSVARQLFLFTLLYLPLQLGILLIWAT